MDQPTTTNLEVDEVSGNYFKDAGKWARFVGWVYICCIIFAGGVIALNSGAFMRAINNYTFNRQVRMEASLMGILIALDMVALLVISWFILRAANHIRGGIDRRDQVTFNEGLKALKNGLMLYGILVLAGLFVNVFTTFA